MLMDLQSYVLTLYGLSCANKYRRVSRFISVQFRQLFSLMMDIFLVLEFIKFIYLTATSLKWTPTEYMLHRTYF